MPTKKVRERKPRMFAVALRSLAAGTIAFVLLVLVDQLSGHFGLTGLERLGDNLLGAIIIGTLIYLDDRRRNRYLADRLRVIALMNHHVRNSLQAIKYAHQTDRQVQLINEAAARIEWALREVLPGDMVDVSMKSGAQNVLGPQMKPTPGQTLERNRI